MILAVTGHRPERLVIGGQDAYQPDVAEALRLFAKRELMAFVDLAKDTELVITGGALGLDAAIAQAAYDIELPFAVYVPFDGQSAVWGYEARDRYERLLERAAHVLVVSDGPYASWKFIKRNKKMVDQADHLLALYDGSGTGGTAQCVAYANECLCPITNVWDSWVEFADNSAGKEPWEFNRRD